MQPQSERKGRFILDFPKTDALSFESLALGTNSYRIMHLKNRKH